MAPKDFKALVWKAHLEISINQRSPLAATIPASFIRNSTQEPSPSCTMEIVQMGSSAPETYSQDPTPL